MATALDNPVWASLTGPQSSVAVADTLAARYRKGVNPIGAVREDTDAAWRALANLAEVGEILYTGQIGAESLPDNWAVEREEPMLQMVLTRPVEPDASRPGPIELGESDRDAVRELVELTKPGPFDRDTMALGRFVGARENGRLISMAGERFQLDGYREISAVCTHPDFQGRGLARWLVTEIAAGMRARGEIPFLHVLANNTGAVALYRKMGFETRVEMTMRVLRRVR